MTDACTSGKNDDGCIYLNYWGGAKTPTTGVGPERPRMHRRILHVTRARATEDEKRAAVQKACGATHVAVPATWPALSVQVHADVCYQSFEACDDDAAELVRCDVSLGLQDVSSLLKVI